MTIAFTDLVLIDTSIWIDYFRKKEPLFEEVENLIEQERVCIVHFIVAEILQGAKSDEEFKILQSATEIFHSLEEQADTWVEAARLSNHLRRTGNPIGLGDCYIATLASQHNAILWTLDKHFKQIKKFLKIKLYRD